MAATALRREESLGLALALVAHAGLIGWLVWQRAPMPIVIPERMTVTISEDTGPVSAAPLVQPEEAAPDKGPVIGEAPPPPAPLARPEPQPQPQQKSPVAQPPKPVTRAPPAQPARPPVRPATRGGASAFDNAFANGVPGAANGKAKAPPASQASAQQISAWKSQIVGKVVGRFGACAVPGLDVDQLYFDIHFTLTIEGQIENLGQVQVGGINAANRAQVEPLKACVLKAIKQSAPFSGLPPEFYSNWKTRNVRLRAKE